MPGAVLTSVGQRCQRRSRVAGTASPDRGRPLACVIGDMDLVRPLGLAGIQCAPLARAGEPTCYSRFTRGRIPWVDLDVAPEALVETLLAFADGQEKPLVLFYQGDREMLVISRHRKALSEAFKFVAAEPDLVEALADKGRFAEVTQRLGLPVPHSRILSTDAASGRGAPDLRFPVVVKPTMHAATWDALHATKAVEVGDQDALNRECERLASVTSTILAQESVPGPDTRIESYHVYVDADGLVAAEFTGRKIRTLPARFGYSTAVEITDQRDVRYVGRDCVQRLRLRGVAKLDFKRDPDGKLWLLEVNPRFTLWHLPGALAGVNIPALVYADLAGRPRPATRRIRPGVTWCEPKTDFQARTEHGVRLDRWLAWFLRADAKRAIALDDPLPFVVGIGGRRLLDSRTRGVRPVAAREG